MLGATLHAHSRDEKGKYVMGKVINKRIRGMFTLLGALVVFVSAGLLAPQSVIASSRQPAYASNHILVKLKPGKQISDLSGFARQYRARVRKTAIAKSIYIMDLPKGVTPERIINNRSALISRYKSVEKLSFDYKFKLTAPVIPNDTFFVDQWALQPDSHIFAPEGWDYFSQVPTREVVVAVVDSGVRDRQASDPEAPAVIVRIPHPDLAPSILSRQGVDYGELDFDPSPTEYSLDALSTGHGTHVAGIIAARSNNALGVAGLANNTNGNTKVWILPVKVSDYTGTIFTSSIINALFALPNMTLRSPATGASLKVNVVNMSLGVDVDIPEVQQAVRALVDEGIVVVAASGNDETAPVVFPAAYPEVIAVGAAGQLTDQAGNVLDPDSDVLADFSSFGPELDLIAPGVNIPSTWWTPLLAAFVFEDEDVESGGGGGGGDPPTPGALNLTQGLPVQTDTFGNAIIGMPGTSMASPHVAAAAAMLMSTGVPANEVSQFLKENATDIGFGVPSDRAGFGLLNLVKTLSNSTVNMSIVNPVNGGVSAALKTRFRIDFRNADIDTIRVVVDNVLIAGPAIENPAIPNWKDFYTDLGIDNKARLEFDYVVNDAFVDHTLRVQVLSASIPPVGFARASRSGQIRFSVNKFRLTAGWNLFAIPFAYDTSRTPESVLNADGATLFRWTYASSEAGQYAKYVLGPNGAPKDPEASFAPPSIFTEGSILMPLGTATVTPPAGLGYWLRIVNPDGQDVPDTIGTAVGSTPYEIQLNAGWNLIGNPFLFPVSWNNAMIEFNGVRVSTVEAASRGWIADAVFRWDKVLSGGQGQYVRKKMVNGIMVPWEAQWMKVKVKGAKTWPLPDMKLIVPPNPYTGLIP